MRKLAKKVRVGFALILVALVFTNAFEYWAEQRQHLVINHSPFTIYYASYLICALIFAFDRASIRRALDTPVVRWTFGAILLATWGMLRRSFMAPPGIDEYTFERIFGIQLNAFAFMIACVIIFDDDTVLYTARRAIAVATVLGIVLNVYELFYPGWLNQQTIGRSAGLYVNPNDGGMALALGCLMSVSVVPSALREVFVLACLAGVVTTLSREALLGLAIVMIGMSIGGVLAWKRMLATALCGAIVLTAIGINSAIKENKIFYDATSRFYSVDQSAAGRLQMDFKMLDEFEEAPLLGHGFGTSTYWAAAESHNLYLSFLADYGIIGLLVIPSLVLSIGWRRRNKEFYVFALIFMSWCFLTHFVFDLGFALMTLGIEAVQTGRQGPEISDPAFASSRLRHGA